MIFMHSVTQHVHAMVRISKCTFSVCFGLLRKQLILRDFWLRICGWMKVQLMLDVLFFDSVFFFFRGVEGAELEK